MGDAAPGGAVDVEVLVIGAGVTGLYQLYRAREDGFSTLLLEAGDGVGGTWYWNRYPEARFDSESYTYAYVFSEDMFREWEWSERFAGQPEVERYFQRFVERFDLAPLIRFGTKVTSVVWDDASGTWTVTAEDGRRWVARFVVAATGMLSYPYVPEVPGRDDFRGESHHTGLWPAEGVDVTGKRVAVIGTGSSGVQVIPPIAAEAAELVVYQRTPNWCTPLNNAPITPDEQRALQAGFEHIQRTLNTSATGFLTPPPERMSTEDTAEERQAFFETMWNSPGFAKLLANYKDLLSDPDVNREWCDFIAAKVRAVVEDPATAERLIPKDHRYGEKRPPFVTGYFEVFNEPHVSLVSLEEHPMVRLTETGIETTDGHREFDVVVWATGFDYGTGQLRRLGVRGVDGVALEDHWADGPLTYLGVHSSGFPNFFFPGGPHGASANVPRYNTDQADHVADLLVAMREQGHDVVDVPPALEQEFTDMIDQLSRHVPFTKISYFFGSNIPGKPVRNLLNPGGRPMLFRFIQELRDDGYSSLSLSSRAAADPAAP
ncbi:flavin-containing monooxygenase [Dermatobacter hominis]|uniref:flavin-containing monooxygenase n=1 Tax=Dermatobacter hominis TaxID=2884263 RepID=UPI001D0F5994|nr:NAD(P)/FAD-dependent oxidoreductase [Dermatobacter hominis]UDY36704.1 NAD(P)/FAD-dependent oxidoreductase [Dermatobacter hominis]